jgi:hypothetical protein
MSVIDPVPVQKTGMKLTPRYGAEGSKREAAERVWAIRAGLVDLAGLVENITEAWEAEDWKALGYGSWANYIAAEYGVSAFPKLTAEDRDGIMRDLADTMSTRAIASVLGVGKSTVHRAIAAGVPNGTAEPEPAKAKGLDGKQHPATKPTTKPEPGPPATNDPKGPGKRLGLGRPPDPAGAERCQALGEEVTYLANEVRRLQYASFTASTDGAVVLALEADKRYEADRLHHRLRGLAVTLYGQALGFGITKAEQDERRSALSYRMNEEAEAKAP